MIELALIAGSGLLGSAHCIGMCGPFALAIATGEGGWKRNLARQAAYTLGRIFTYSFLGALVGFGGWKLSEQVAWYGPAGLAWLAGGLLLFFGAQHLGVLPHGSHRLFSFSAVTHRTREVSGARRSSCLATAWMGPFLKAGGYRGVFLAGIFTGFLPCGLVYSALALAASRASIWEAAAAMALFGLGTAPVMMATGVGGNLLSVSLRRRVFRFAAICMLLAGAMSIARGVAYARASAGHSQAACPFCESVDKH